MKEVLEQLEKLERRLKDIEKKLDERPYYVPGPVVPTYPPSYVPSWPVPINPIWLEAGNTWINGGGGHFI